MVVASCDLLTRQLARPAARAGARFSAAAVVLAIARASEVSWAELGLGRREVGSGVRAGLAAGACVAVAALAGGVLPPTRAYFLDDRATATAGPGGLSGELARITFAAVPPEELTYRSALLGLGLASASPASAVGWSSAMFGLSHISPTLSTMGHSAMRGQVAGRPLRPAIFVAVNVAVTSVAGAGFAWLRLRSGSVIAPLIAHAALNDAALVAARAAHQLSGSSGN